MATKRARSNSVKFQKSNKKRKFQRKGKKRVYSNTITEQRDVAVDYQSSGWKYRRDKFAERVRAVMRKHLPSKTVLSAIPNWTQSTVAATEQLWFAVHLKPYATDVAVPGAGSLYNEPAQTDIQTGWRYQNPEDNNTTYEKGTCTYAEAEINLENSGAGDMVADIYELMYTKAWSNNNLQNLFSALNVAPSSDSSTYTFNTYGINPFDFPSLISSYGVKVVKKTRVIMKSGDNTCYKMFDKRKQYFDYDNMGGGQQALIPGLSRTALVICRTNTSDAVTSIRVNAIKKYHLKHYVDMGNDTN